MNTTQTAKYCLKVYATASALVGSLILLGLVLAAVYTSVAVLIPYIGLCACIKNIGASLVFLWSVMYTSAIITYGIKEEL